MAHEVRGSVLHARDAYALQCVRTVESPVQLACTHPHGINCRHLPTKWATWRRLWPGCRRKWTQCSSRAARA